MEHLSYPPLPQYPSTLALCVDFFQGRRQTVHCPYRCMWQQQHWEVQLTTMAIRTELFETGGQVQQRPTRVLIGFDHFVRLDPA